MPAFRRPAGLASPGPGDPGEAERAAARTGGEEPPWMAGFGALSDISGENRRVLEAIEMEFERLTPEDVA